MTMQMPDKFIYCGEEVELLSANPKIAFTPLLFGIEASGWTTSNHRGFWCDYSIDGFFLVKNLYLYSKNGYPVINGKIAEKIPIYAELIETINSKRSIKYRYIDGMPMQYIGIDYIYEYSGNLIVGFRDQTNKGINLKVYNFYFDRGRITKNRDITDNWNTSQ